jgi:hypothetical protein
MVNRAVRRGSWLVFSIHELTPADAAILDHLIEYIHRRGIPIVTISQALDMP